MKGRKERTKIEKGIEYVLMHVKIRQLFACENIVSVETLQLELNVVC